ncbi:holo-ACP synthase [Mycoplasma sp. 128]|uniref:holo-ACP synthase n=1 Tax=Mycoplasma sp. 3341 TaxID=3447506 RepID=UPI003F657933
MYKIGIDLVNINRFKEVKEHFIKRFLSDIEYVDYQKSENKDIFLATRWALKEAIYKADNSEYSFKDISISKDITYRYKNFSLSTSSEGEFVIAMAIKN